MEYQNSGPSGTLKILSQLKPLSHCIDLYNLEQAIHTYFKSLSPTPRNLQILHALSNTNMTFFYSFFPILVNQLKSECHSF